jgi:hypothetical protein
MSDIAELWSLPWHELQRSLAAGFGGSAAGQAGGSGSPFVRVVGAPCVISPVGSWLVRARAAPGRWTGRPQNNCRITVR